MTVPYGQEEIVEKFNQQGITFEKQGPIADGPGWLQTENATAYRIEQLIIGKDTLRKLDFGMRTIKPGKTGLYFAGMQVADSISNQKLQRELSRYYKKLVFHIFKNSPNAFDR